MLTLRLLQLSLLYTALLLTTSTPEEEWKKFKKDYKKTYKPSKEEQLRFKIFRDNLKEIEDHNKLYSRGEKTYKKGVTKFTDLTDDEFTNKFGLRQGIQKVYLDEVKSKGKDEPEYLNWKERGAVTNVKDQGSCGSCWIFSAIGALEGHHFRKTNELISFSEQNMVDCISNRTCNGGWSPLVFDHINKTGKLINREEDYPYRGDNGECRHDSQKGVRVDFDDWFMIDETEKALREALIKHGPIIVSLAANENWKLYKEGIWYEPICSESINHSLLVIGYGSENGSDYWLIKNSFGAEWGEGGFIKFARNRHGNYCGITDMAFYLK